LRLEFLQAIAEQKGVHIVVEPECRSEVALLMRQITLEYEAAQRGLSELAAGTAQHKMITSRMENMGRLHEELVRSVGAQQAVKLFAEALEQAGE